MITNNTNTTATTTCSYPVVIIIIDYSWYPYLRGCWSIVWVPRKYYIYIKIYKSTITTTTTCSYPVVIIISYSCYTSFQGGWTSVWIPYKYKVKWLLIILLLLLLHVPTQWSLLLVLAIVGIHIYKVVEQVCEFLVNII